MKANESKNIGITSGKFSCTKNEHLAYIKYSRKNTSRARLNQHEAN